MAQGQSTPPQPKITGVLTILSPKPGVTVEQVMKIMPAEIRATVPLYLDGKIQQWFTRGDGRGVIFILNCKDEAEARALIESLPLSKENLMDEVHSGRATLAARILCGRMEPNVTETIFSMPCFGVSRGCFRAYILPSLS
jgi:hypothetical protein